MVKLQISLVLLFLLSGLVSPISGLASPERLIELTQSDSSCDLEGKLYYLAQFQAGTSSITPQRSQANLDDSRLIELQRVRARDIVVSYSGRVYKLLPDDRQGKPHQRFLVKLSNGSTILIAHNINLAAYIPLKVGDYVRIQGQYIWNDKGGVIHYTHRSTSRRKQGGFIEHAGMIYQ